MTAVKEKIVALIETMPTPEAERLFLYIVENYQLNRKNDTWSDIEEIEPDEIDLQMLKEIEIDPECQDFN